MCLVCFVHVSLLKGCCLKPYYKWLRLQPGLPWYRHMYMLVVFHWLLIASNRWQGIAWLHTIIVSISPVLCIRLISLRVIVVLLWGHSWPLCHMTCSYHGNSCILVRRRMLFICLYCVRGPSITVTTSSMTYSLSLSLSPSSLLGFSLSFASLSLFLLWYYETTYISVPKGICNRGDRTLSSYFLDSLCIQRRSSLWTVCT